MLLLLRVGIADCKEVQIKSTKLLRKGTLGDLSNARLPYECAWKFQLSGQGLMKRMDDMM
jgi:hypothetical protein